MRAKQSYRYLDGIGFLLISFAIFILAGFLLSTLQTILQAPKEGAFVLVALLLFTIEIKRKDLYFLKSIFATKNQLLLYKFAENLFIICPILLFQTYFGHLQMVASLIAVNALLSLLFLGLKWQQDSSNKSSFKWIPLHLFEVKFYIEKQPWSFALIWVLLALGSVHISLWILGIFFLIMMPIDIYKQQEPREMINYSKHFVLKKIIRCIKFFLLFISIPTLITLVFLSGNILIPIYGVIALLLAIILAISKKYNTYYGVNEYNNSTTATMILTFLMVAPGGILITITAAGYYYLKAEKHMKNQYART